MSLSSILLQNFSQEPEKLKEWERLNFDLQVTLAWCDGDLAPEERQGLLIRTQLLDAGEAAFTRADLEAATEAFEGALTLARRADDPAGIGAAAYDLAACRLAAGRAEEAWPLLAEAELALERADRSRAAVRPCLS